MTQYLLFSNIYLTVYVQCLASNSASVSNLHVTASTRIADMQENEGEGGGHREKKTRGRGGRGTGDRRGQRE